MFVSCVCMCVLPYCHSIKLSYCDFDLFSLVIVLGVLYWWGCFLPCHFCLFQFLWVVPVYIVLWSSLPVHWICLLSVGSGSSKSQSFCCDWGGFYMSLGSCNFVSNLGHFYLVTSAVVIRSMSYYCSMQPGSYIFMLHHCSWSYKQKRNISMSIYISICMRLPVYEDSVVTIITII